MSSDYIKSSLNREKTNNKRILGVRSHKLDIIKRRCTFNINPSRKDKKILPEDLNLKPGGSRFNILLTYNFHHRGDASIVLVGNL